MKKIILTLLIILPILGYSQDTIVTKWNDKFPCFLVKLEKDFIIVSKKDIPMVMDSIKYPLSNFKYLILDERCGLNWKSNLDTIHSYQVNDKIYRDSLNRVIFVEDYLKGTLLK